jgi:uncharacterized protein (DUF302 family)
MKTGIVLFLGGLVVGAIVMGVVMWMAMPGLMLNVNRSNLDFEETVSTIERAAVDQGWMVPKVYDIQKSLRNAGHSDMTRVKVIPICQPHHAYDILEDDGKKVTAIMPCRIGIYEDQSGQVYVSEMNTELMSKMFGGTIAEVMGGVAAEEEEILKGIIGDAASAN